MARHALCLFLCLGPLWQPPPVQTQDPEVARGIREIEDGDIDRGIVTLDVAARRLVGDASRTRDLAQAYLYIGIGYVGRGQEALAKARFRAAVTQHRELSLSSEHYATKVIALFDAAKQEVLALDPSPRAPAGSPQPSSPPPKKGGSKTPLILAGIAVAGGAGIAVARGGGGDGPPSTAPSYRLDAADTQSLPARGGGGSIIQMSCPPGFLMVGIIGWSDINVVLGLGARCAQLLSDGSLSGEFLVPRVGSFTGSPGLRAAPFDDPCPPGQAVVRVSGSVGVVPIGVVAIQSVGIGCANVREWVASGAAGQDLLPHGNTSGMPFADPCSNGYAVTSFTAGSSTNVVERLAATCTRIRR